MRKVNVIFPAFFILEIVLLLGLIYFGSTVQGNLVENISSKLFPVGTLIASTAIAYHHFWLHPELKFTGVVIEPLDFNRNNVALPKFRSRVYKRGIKGYPKRVRDNIEPDHRDGFKVIETISPCYEIRMADDVANVGGSKMTLHDYCVTMLKPIKKPKETYISRRVLENEERETIDFFFPAGNGEYEFKIEVNASGKKMTRRVKIEVLNNCSKIRWKEYDC